MVAGQEGAALAVVPTFRGTISALSGSSTVRQPVPACIGPLRRAATEGGGL